MLIWNPACLEPPCITGSLPGYTKTKDTATAADYQAGLDGCASYCNVPSGSGTLYQQFQIGWYGGGNQLACLCGYVGPYSGSTFTYTTCTLDDYSYSRYVRA